MEINYYYNINKYYTHELVANSGSLPPINAVRVKPNFILGYWPKWTGTVWENIENHTNLEYNGRSKKATEYWLPEDVWNTPARTMTKLGALPSNALFTAPEKPMSETLKDLQNEFDTAITNRLDQFAQTRLYANIGSACTYVDSTIPKFKAEALYCVQLRDLTYIQSYSILDDVLSGRRPIPTLQEVLDELPTPKWPDEQ